MMEDSERIAIAKAYVDASNAHDVGAIAAMLAPDVAYRSSGVGSHDGVPAILAMNRKFFADYPDVHWDPANWRITENGGVTFDFTITLGGATHQGTESVVVGDDGLITRVEVAR